MPFIGVGAKLVRSLERDISQKKIHHDSIFYKTRNSRAATVYHYETVFQHQPVPVLASVKNTKKRGQKKMKNTFNYIPAGDYYIPDITLQECPKPIGKWGRIYQNYLKNHHPVRYNSLMVSGQLWTCLGELNEQAQQRMGTIIAQMAATEAVTAELKATDPMAWAGSMNSIRSRAEEIVLRELIWEEEAI